MLKKINLTHFPDFSSPLRDQLSKKWVIERGVGDHFRQCTILVCNYKFVFWPRVFWWVGLDGVHRIGVSTYELFFR